MRDVKRWTFPKPVKTLTTILLYAIVQAPLRLQLEAQVSPDPTGTWRLAEGSKTGADSGKSDSSVSKRSVRNRVSQCRATLLPRLQSEPARTTFVSTVRLPCSTRRDSIESKGRASQCRMASGEATISAYRLSRCDAPTRCCSRQCPSLPFIRTSFYLWRLLLPVQWSSILSYTVVFNRDSGEPGTASRDS